MKTIKIEKSDLITRLKSKRATQRKNLSKWKKGVYDYAEEMLDDLDDFIIEFNDIHDKTDIILNFGKQLLNGAPNTRAYSWGGCSLIYNEDIAQRLCTTSELKKKDYGRLQPTSKIEWLDLQARAIYQAIILLKNILNELIYNEFDYIIYLESLDKN